MTTEQNYRWGPPMWIVDEVEPDGHVRLTDVQDVTVARVYQQPLDPWNAVDTAHRVAQAVNAYDDMLAALEEAHRSIHGMDWNDPRAQPATNKGGRMIRAAIAKAKGSN
jgi:hypothetical protein